MACWRWSLCLLFPLLLSGCPLEGDSGDRGLNGISCWDLDGDRNKDPDEDLNGDGQWDARDCSASSIPTQATGADFNHQHVCEAFANLGQYPEGCPSDTHTVPVGTLTRMLPDLLFEDTEGNLDSCNYEPNNGVFGIEKKNNAYYWSVEGGFIANKFVISLNDEIDNNVCFQTCDSDDNCIASWASLYTEPPMIAYYDCYHFYHSDTVGVWDHRCDSDLDDCLDALSFSSTSQRWNAVCP